MALAETLAEAHKLRDLDKSKEALAVYDLAVAKFPNDATVLIARSDLFKEMGALDRALQDINKALALAPTNLAALRLRGHYFDMSGKLSLAIADYTRLAAAKPAEAGPLRDRAIAYKRLGRYKEAARDFLKAAQVEPGARDFGKTLYGAGDMALLSGDPAAALKIFDQLARAEPDLSSAFWGRARAYDKLGKANEARADRLRARKLDENLDGIGQF